MTILARNLCFVEFLKFLRFSKLCVHLAPEILQKKGHNYQVDVWSLGCMLYTLIVGKPPFETSTLKETYSRIKNGQYTIPSHVSNDGAEVIKKMLADTEWLF